MFTEIVLQKNPKKIIIWGVYSSIFAEQNPISGGDKRYD